MSSSSAPPPTTSAPPSESITSTTPLSALNDVQILELTQKIKDEAAQAQPLVDVLRPIDETLKREYEGGAEGFRKKVEWLDGQGWKEIRKLRGDGSCFYRAFGFSYVENLSNKPKQQIEAAIRTIESLLPLCQQVGYEDDIIEEFWEPLRTLLQSLPLASPNEIFSQFNDPTFSSYTITFLRLLTSAFLRSNSEDYLPYIFALEDDPRFLSSLVESGDPGAGIPYSVEDFCKTQVDPVDKEADHIQIAALTKALCVKLKVAYLDQGFGGVDEVKVDFHDFGEDEGAGEGGGSGAGTGEVRLEKVALLFRPGHYDLIYKSS